MMDSFLKRALDELQNAVKTDIAAFKSKVICHEAVVADHFEPVSLEDALDRITRGIQQSATIATTAHQDIDLLVEREYHRRASCAELEAAARAEPITFTIDWRVPTPYRVRVTYGPNATHGRSTVIQPLFEGYNRLPTVKESETVLCTEILDEHGNTLGFSNAQFVVPVGGYFQVDIDL